MEPSRGVTLKLNRARQLLTELTAAVDAFLQSQPFSLEEEQESDILVTIVRVRQYPPDEWSVLLGDSLHNARSALDHLAWQLVESAGATPGRNTYFPISDDEQKSRKAAPSKLKGASSSARDAVAAQRPWRGGNDKLWRLHQLDIKDKHCLLVPVGAAHTGTSVRVFGVGESGPFETPPLTLRTPNSQFRLQDGARLHEVAGAAPAAGRSADRPQLYVEVTLDVFFGDGSVVTGEPLVPTVTELVEQAETTAYSVLTAVDP